MQKNKKVLVGLAVLGIAFLIPSTTQAATKYNWKTYFSFEQVKAIQNKTNNGVLNKIKNDKQWKDAISDAVKIEDSSITSEKIKDDTVTGSDIKAGTITSVDVDNTIVKKKIYTGTAPTSIGGADKVVVDDSDGTLTEYYFKLDIPEISTSNMPIVHVYNKAMSEPALTSFAGMWTEDNVPYIENGKIWIGFAEALDADPTNFYIDDYKVVVEY